MSGGDAAPARATFIDLARVLAVAMMLEGHTLDAVLAPGSLTGAWLTGWTFIRGLTSSMFLLLSGFTFTLATHRRWHDHAGKPSTILRRLRRFGFFLVMGYALHLPVGRLAHVQGLSPDRWATFLMVDVLHCIAVSLATLQALVLLSQRPGRFALAAAGACIAVVTLTPLMWRTTWSFLPDGIAGYLSPAGGSLFPLFPWAAYVFFGAALGELYVRWGRGTFEAFKKRALVAGGIGMVSASWMLSRVPLRPFGPTDYWTTSPNQFLLRAGLVLLVLGVVAHLGRRLHRPPFIAHALAQESLVIYAVHLCLVYGSAWNPGLRQLVGPVLPIVPALAVVGGVVATMALLAGAWYRCKHHQPVAAQWIRVGVAGILLGRFLR